MTKRHLTAKEIEDIIDFVKPTQGIPSRAANAVVNNIKKDLREDLKKQVVYPAIIPQLKKELRDMYYSTLVQPGESVGVLTAQSIGEKQTQLTLDTFHKAGLSEKIVTEGVPRFEELINVTKSPKNICCSVYFTEGTDSMENLRRTIGNTIVELRLKSVSKNIRISKEVVNDYWVDAFKILYNDYFTEYTYYISIDLDMKILYEYNMDIEFIAEVIENNYADLFCVFSPIHIGKLYIYVKTGIIYEREFSEEQLLYINDSNKEQIYMEEVVLPILKELLICGIPGITNIFYLKDKDEWMVDTEGSNYQKLLCHPKVDYTRTTSNNIWDIYNVLGINAAKQSFINEFMGLMSGINECHAKLLVDMMTYSKSIASISRYTMRKQESGPLGKCSFEETLDNLLKAAIYGDKEPTIGVSSSIICGKRPKMGSGLCEIHMDLDALQDIN
jgi:DNA-directed RNA polymerase beta' subunit